MRPTPVLLHSFAPTRLPLASKRRLPIVLTDEYLAACNERPAEVPRKLLILELHRILVFPEHVNLKGKQYIPYFPRPYLSALHQYLTHSETRDWLHVAVCTRHPMVDTKRMIREGTPFHLSDFSPVYTPTEMFPKLSPVGRNTAIHPKDLTVLWNGILPHKRHSPASTLLVDGLARGGAQQPHNLVLLPEYAKPLRRLDLDRFHQLLGTKFSKAQLAATRDRARERLRRSANPKTRPTGYELRLTEQGVYDDALIAFLGVLEHLKPVRNVAAWIRGGGLFGVHDPEEAPPYNETTAPWFDDRAVFGMWLEQAQQQLEPNGLSSDFRSPPLMATIHRTLAGSPVSLSSPSRTSTYETSSGSSSSTVPGPGALSGKAIKALGRVTIRGIDHLVILRQLSVIAHHFPLPDEKAGNPQLGTVFFTPLLSAYTETEISGHLSISPFLLFISKLVRSCASACRAVLDVGFLDVLILIRSLNDLNKEDVLSDLKLNQSDPSHRKRTLAVGNAVLLDILAYPELRPIVLNHPICSTWVTPQITTIEIAPFASRERALFLNSDRDIPDDNSLLYLTLDLQVTYFSYYSKQANLVSPVSPTVSKLGHVDEMNPGQLVDSLAFGVEHDQALRVFMLRSPYTKKVALLSEMIQYMWERSSTPSLSFSLRTRYRLLFFLRLVTAIAWGPSNRAALLDAGTLDFLVHIAQTEVPESYRAIIDVGVPFPSHAQDDLRMPAIIREQGLGHLLGGPLSKTSRLVGLISAAFGALFPEDVKPDSMRSGMNSLPLERMERGNPTASPTSPSDESAEPRVTVSVWRVLNTVILLVFASYKVFGPKPELTSGDWIIGGTWAAYAYWIGNIGHDNPGAAPWLFTYDLSFVRTALAELSAVVSSPVLQIPFFLGIFFPFGPTRPFAAYLWLYALALLSPFFVFMALRTSTRLGFLRRNETGRDLALLCFATLCDIGVATLLLLFFNTPTQTAAYWFAVCFMAGTLTSVAIARGATSTPAMALYRRFLSGTARGRAGEERTGEEDKKGREK
ncbi:hypothetical protein C8F04DRAFT_1397659 [Mycena alexandri]|uniref:Uncharacterized protein n=1 Tax=Mycena alexandri TaxID=1745969 RepID=A0AAD6SMV0_9AGAR|nr:hypothetical protein C8F04DRAFT_1397659 [Mycena alexandri]